MEQTATKVEQIQSLYEQLSYEDQLKTKEWMEDYIIKNSFKRIPEKLNALENKTNSFLAKVKDKFKI